MRFRVSLAADGMKAASLPQGFSGHEFRTSNSWQQEVAFLLPGVSRALADTGGDRSIFFLEVSMYDKSITSQIINAAFEVQRVLGAGFMENVYKHSLAYELSLRGIYCETEKVLDVFYKSSCVGVYKADLIVNNTVIVELKCVRFIANAHIKQLKHYLRATDIHTGLVLNFQACPLELKRVFG